MVRSSTASVPGPQFMERLGEVIWLLRQSPGYEDADLDRVEALFIQPLRLDQLRVFRQSNRPVGLVAWAHLNEDAETRYLATGVLNTSDWQSGGRFWFTDFLAPFGHVGALTRAACAFVPPNAIARGTRRDKTGRVRRITKHFHRPHGV